MVFDVYPWHCCSDRGALSGAWVKGEDEWDDPHYCPGVSQGPAPPYDIQDDEKTTIPQSIIIIITILEPREAMDGGSMAAAAVVCYEHREWGRGDA